METSKKIINLLLFKSNIWIQLFDLHSNENETQKTLDMQRDTKKKLSNNIERRALDKSKAHHWLLFLIQHFVGVWIISTLHILHFSVKLLDKPGKQEDIIMILILIE